MRPLSGIESVSGVGPSADGSGIQGPTGELAKVRDRLSKLLSLPLGVKHDRVQMRRHDDPGVNPKSFVPMTERQTVGDNPACRFGDEYGQPLDHAERHEIHRPVVADAIAFHKDHRCFLGGDS